MVIFTFNCESYRQDGNWKITFKSAVITIKILHVLLYCQSCPFWLPPSFKIFFIFETGHFTARNGNRHQINLISVNHQRTILTGCETLECKEIRCED